MLDANRIDRAEAGFRHCTSENIRRITGGDGNRKTPSRAAPDPYRRANGTEAMSVGGRPDVGDDVSIAEPPVFRQLSERVIRVPRTPEAGQPWWIAESGQEEGQRRKVCHDRALVFSGCGNPKLIGNSPNRSVMGWLVPDRLDYGSPPRALPFAPVISGAEAVFRRRARPDKGSHAPRK